MIPSLSPVTAGGALPLEQQIALAARHDFRGLEISIPAAQALGLEKAQSLFSDFGVLPVSFGLPVEWRKDDAKFEADFALLEERAAFAKSLGVQRSHTWVLPDNGAPAREYSQISSERLEKIASVFASHNIQLALEFLGPAHFRKTPGNSWFHTIEGALEVADALNQKIGKTTVGLLVDAFHWHAGNDNLMSLAAVPLDQIVNVHINDAPKGVAREDLIDNVRELPGATGEIDLAGFLSTLRALGYQGAVAVETFSERLKSLSPDEAAEEASAAVKKVMENAK